MKETYDERFGDIEVMTSKTGNGPVLFRKTHKTNS